ncbi:hypothetical protein L1049_026251 [Liquidambar formosana]|uniref:Epidermal growth factor receptor substrate 15-like 1 n=1 Tax=Liquidambar formosana TaxID=63359 RepID=A0AAP0NG19_LIQFO
MAGQNQGANMDLFDAYFRRADLDGDGRISGAEAVSFFQGSNLPKNVLAQIWMHADQARTGFLGRTEFYNALKLVTVAQSKRELTPDIVKAALFGPAAAKIPAPQINLAATPAPKLNSVAAAPVPQMGAVAPTSSQNLGFRAQGLPNANMNQHYFASQQNQLMRPPQATPVGTTPRPSQGIVGPEQTRGGSMVGSGVPNSNISGDWFSVRTSEAPTGATSQPQNIGISSSMPSTASKAQDLVLTSSQPATKDSRAPVVSGNGFASDPVFGGDVFSATSSLSKQDPNALTYSASGAPAPSATAPISMRPQSPVKPGPLDSLQSSFTTRPAGGQLQHAQSQVNSNQQGSAQITSSLASSGISVGVGNSTSNQSQLPWPRMKPSDVQKYTKVFVEVDTDRDGKITGEQARNLFLSWRLPREVLKQVWDLSDQDNDSMLSLREFCISLYLMERHREGRPLPPALPSNIMFDETLLSVTGQSTASYGNAAWGPTPGVRQQQGMPGTRPMTPAGDLRHPMQVSAPQADVSMQPNLQKSRGTVLEDPFANHFGIGEQNSVNTKSPEAKDAEKKVEETEKVILDSKEKIEFYRTKMQDLVLYKSRCDNRLNEITERASADKREAESLTKKYEEKYKQVAEIASKLTIEEAKFRDTQERKMELQQAIVKMEQGGSSDGILQVRVDRIQSHLDELMRGLTERCKKHGLHVNSTALFELPIGWQPGMQEGAVDWDEDWDKFEDEGFSFVKEHTLDVQNGIASPKAKSTSVWIEKASSDSLSNADFDSEKPLHTGEHDLESESAYAHSEDDQGRNSLGSPVGRTALESPSQEFSDIHFGKSTEADTETHRSFDEPAWGTFDNNDDTDSVWGFNPVNTKDSDPEKHRENYLFGSGDLSVRTESPQSDSIFQKKSPFTFGDSVPSTPHSKSGNSPPRYSEASGDHFFDNFSRFDSFSMHDSGFSPQRETLTRFDSMSSSRDFAHSREFTSFDDADPFGSSGPFKVSSESQTPRRDSGNWNAF